MQFEIKHKTWIAVISVVAVLIGFWLFNPHPLYFLNDDLVHIPLSKEGVLLQRNSLRPFGDWSVQMDYVFWGKNAAGYHLTNLVLHVINTILVFILSKELLKKYSDSMHENWLSLLTAILFFVYAFHSETVFWILGRSGSLGTLFFLPALIFYLTRFEGRKYFIASVILFAAGLFAYESVWIFPLAILLFAWLDKNEHRQERRREVVFIAMVWIVFSLYLALRYSLINEVAGRYEASAFLELDILKLASNFGRLLYRSFAPPIFSNGIMVIALALILLLVPAILFATRNKSNRLILLLGALVIISLLPYLSLGVNTHTVEGERYLYMPSVFASMLLVVLISSIARRPALVVAAWSLLLIYHLIYLKKSRDYYITASEISRMTYSEINALENKSRLFIDSLPQGVNGALIFRLGFDEGLQWLKEKRSVDSVFVVSVKQLNNLSGPYGVVKSFSQPRSLDEILIRDTSQRRTYVAKRVAPLKFNPATDAWFVFSDTGLVVTK